MSLIKDSAINAYGWDEVQLHAFLTSAWDVTKCLDSQPTCLPLQDMKLGGPQVRSRSCGDDKYLLAFHGLKQPVCRPYSDWSILYYVPAVSTETRRLREVHSEWDSNSTPNLPHMLQSCYILHSDYGKSTSLISPHFTAVIFIACAVYTHSFIHSSKAL
jgi:hypothetical protein